MFDKTSAVMTPLVFIGLAVQLKQREKIDCFFAGISGGSNDVVQCGDDYLLHISDPTMIVGNGDSSELASFWPFAHISAFNKREEDQDVPKERRTFSVDLAVLVMAFLCHFLRCLSWEFFRQVPSLHIQAQLRLLAYY
ncbi:MAG: hypothetical protein R2822_24350 [Spirosomataceae bacterium]